jgi:UDP-N-acetylmuramoylalanine--D-glutamate ligase
MRDVEGKRVTVIGAARSGVAVARLLVEHGASVFVSDSGEAGDDVRKTLDEAVVEYEFGAHSARALEADMIAISPGVPSEVEPVQHALEQGIPVCSEVEIASWFCPAPIVAITGTNGKTTTTALAGYVFESSGRPTLVAGNIGQAFSEQVRTATADHVVVLEVSSFQLDHVEHFRPRVSVILNITPDHLDRYGGSFDRYARSKLRIFENQAEGDVFIYNYDDEVLRKYIDESEIHSGVKVLPFSLTDVPEARGIVRNGVLTLRINTQEEEIMDARELALRGRHNTYNSLAAAMAARVMDVGDEVLRKSLSAFSGVAHRLEFVREVDGVRYVNDSKATNVNAVWYALESFDEPIVLIVGGRDKGNDYSSIRDLAARKVRAIVAIGESTEKVTETFRDDVAKIEQAGSMTEAVLVARRLARSGDAVLLSPACASFDWFANFEERGTRFKEAVWALEASRA